MKQRKYTDLIVDIDSVFYRIGDKNIHLISHEVIKNWFNTLKEHYNIYLVSTRLSSHEVEKRLRNFKVHRIPKGIYCCKSNIDFRRNVIEQLINKTNDRKLSSVLLVSGNPFFLASKENSGITTCYVRELNKEYKETSIASLSVDRVNALVSLGMYQKTSTPTIKSEEKTVKNLDISDYLYIIGSGYNLITRETFNLNATFTKEYNNTDEEQTLVVSANPQEIWDYNHTNHNIRTLFLNTGYNDTIDITPTYEKRLQI